MRKSNCNTVSAISGDGDSQRLTKCASEKAENTFSGAAEKRRRTSATAASDIIAGDLRQQAIELIDGPCPERLMTRDPPSRIPQRLLAQPEPMDTALDFPFNQPGLLQHFQVLRDRGLGRAELTAELARAPGLAPRQCTNHRPAGAVGQGSKREIE